MSRNLWKRLCGLTIAASVFVGCSGLKQKSTQSNRRTPDEKAIDIGTQVITAPNSGSSVSNAVELQAIAILEQRCLNCHASGASAPDWLISSPTSEKDWVTKTPFGLIVKGKPEASRLTIRMFHSAEGGNMPPGSTAESFLKSDFDIVYSWIRDLDKVKPAGPDDQGPDPEVGDKMRPQALTYLDGYCLSCHSGAGATSWNVSTGATEEKWIADTPQGLIIPGNGKQSRIVKFMIYSANGSMPVGATTNSFPKAHYDEIVAWIDALQIPADSPTDTDGLKPGDTVFSPESKLRLGDRNYVADVLFEVYGSTVKGENIRSYLLPFGGPCPVSSGWTAGYSGNECINTRENIDTARSSSSFIQTTFNSMTHSLAYNHIDKLDLTTADAPLVPDSTVVREGYRTLACESITFDGTYNNADPTVPLLKAIQKVQDLVAALQSSAPTPVNFATYPAVGSIPTDSELRVAHMLFFNFADPGAAQIAALRTVATRANQDDVTATGDWPKRFEPWRYVLYTLCLTPDWQIP